MTGKDSQFRELMERVQAGSNEAAAELLESYGAVVRHAVRRRLNPQLRSKFDSLDFVQDVWASFFAHPPAELLHARSENLVAFLTCVARNKVVEATRQRLVAKKFNLNREMSLENSFYGGPAAVVAEQPTPSEVVSRGEQWARVLEGQPLVYRRIMHLLRDGKELVEIARELKLHPRTVHRVAEKLLSRFRL